MRLIDADALDKTITEEFHGISATGFIYFMRDKTPIEVYNRVRDLIDNAPTVLHDNYSMGYQDGVKQVMSERLNGGWHLDIKASNAIKFNKIKAIIDNWAVDDDEHELLEQIADIIDEEVGNETN